MKDRSEAIAQAFRGMVTKKRGISLVLASLMFFGYFGYILALAFNKELFEQKIGVHITMGLPLGLGVIILALMVTGTYVWWANTVYDKLATKLRLILRG
ncbi:Inner membrane protein YjcH [Sporomusa carbonis]|uniref:DUF485 domain-containing protein n=1 Tax=Sporomusa carbonis TaxID=3076075 RepID=UPI003A76CB8C